MLEIRDVNSAKGVTLTAVKFPAKTKEIVREEEKNRDAVGHGKTLLLLLHEIIESLLLRD